MNLSKMFRKKCLHISCLQDLKGKLRIKKKKKKEQHGIGLWQFYSATNSSPVYRLYNWLTASINSADLK